MDQAFNEDYFNYLYGIVITGAKWHFIIYIPNGIYCTSNSEYQINLTKFVIKENLELLHNNMKRVIGIIVGLLKDRVSVNSFLASKRARIKKINKKFFLIIFQNHASCKFFFTLNAYIHCISYI